MDLQGAKLSRLNAIGANFRNTNLSGADLTGARVRVRGKMTVRLMGANLTGTIMPDGNIHGS